VLVALGSRGSHPIGHGRLSQRQVPQRVGDDVRTLIILVYGLGTIALIAFFVSMRRKWEPVKSHWLRDYTILMVVFTVLAFVGFREIHHSSVQRKAQQQQNAQLAPQGKKKNRPPTVEQPRGLNSGGHFDLQLTAAVLGLVLVGGIWYLVWLRRRPKPEWVSLEPSVEEELATVVGETIDDLLREADPRAAVIAAYARMERVLGQGGHPRRPAEAPFEYLSRILLALKVRAGAVRELTELFERAKFSTHPIDASMRERAISALVSVRDDLQAAPA
jgi:hypothetical protein